MKQYIVNLTNHLIGKNRFDETFYRIGNLEKFVGHVKTDLEAGDVRIMSPAKLGEIMCSFEIGDVMAGKKDLFNGVHFSGDCEEMLRELVSLCLALAIRDRLSEERLPGIPRWEGRVPGFQAGFRNVIDDLAAKRRR
jgi:hypothetical protein